ncbi:hypothetical protein [Methylobacterium radiotolerans]|uniref:hypothetical protein n=1 Tax=Methylobacterium radiotolerans TaxID=31998 RepID=UPI0011BE547B|nr:hypothetical protein [Methylobacterium radiotolerans]
MSAAWVQSVGSIIALFVAFKVASRQSARDDRRRQLEAESWRSGLYDIAVEAQQLAQLAAVPKDRASGEAFAAAYDVMHARTIITLLTARINSDKIEAKDVRPAVKILAEFSQLHAIIEAYLPRLRAGQFPFEMRGETFERFERISAALAELKPASRAATV